MSDKWNTDHFFLLWEAAGDELVDKFAGLRFGAEAIDRGYGVASIVALHAPDFRQSLAALSRYKRLTCPELVEVDIAGDDAIVRYRWLHTKGEVPRLLVDTTMASLRELTRRGTAGSVAPIRLELSRRPMDRAVLERYFECPIVFNAVYDAMVFERKALETRFVTADGGAFGHLLADFEKKIVEGEGFSLLAGETRLVIARLLSEGRRPTITEVAGRLKLSNRTLQRRLGEASTSFQQQLSGVRRTTANRLLATTELDPIAIAMLLGFAEPNSFTRAFHMWERTTPLRWRELKQSHFLGNQGVL